jgi:DNA-binding response OmpR family regulator
MQQANSPTILLVDRDADRKERISLLKKNGFKVYPALDITQARERYKPGKFDLIIVSAQANNPQVALAMCDEIARRDANQPLLLMAAADLQLPSRHYLVSPQPEMVVERAKALFAARSGPEKRSFAA